MLVIEVDGGQHADNPDDLKRTGDLEVLGYRVVRFWNDDVLTNIEGVMESLGHQLTHPHYRVMDIR